MLTKSDYVHLALGVISAIIWLLGDKAGLPADAIAYAHTTTIALCGSAFGIAVASPNVPPTTGV